MGLLLKKIGVVYLTAYLSARIWSEAACCPKGQVHFYTQFRCEHFFAEVYVDEQKKSVPHCWMKKACHNGKQQISGSYCGKGACNIFGCNCDNGCFGGNSSEEGLASFGTDHCRGLCVPLLFF